MSVHPVFLLCVVALYFIPTVVGLVRGGPNVNWVIVINVLLGWTFVGWLVALAMAVTGAPARQV